MGMWRDVVYLEDGEENTGVAECALKRLSAICPYIPSSCPSSDNFQIPTTALRLPVLAHRIPNLSLAFLLLP